MSFPDHFSQQANHYARYRPTYPTATGLAAHFQSVIATDPSEQHDSAKNDAPQDEFHL